MWKCYVASKLQCSAGDLALATAQAGDPHGSMVRCLFLGLGDTYPAQWAMLGPRVGKVLPTYNHRQQLTVKEPYKTRSVC